METILSRHKNVVFLVSALLLQFLLLAVQIKRPTEHGSVRLIRIVAIRTITPIEKAIVHTRTWFGDTWRNYVYLRGLRHANEQLEQENARLRMEQVRMVQDASQAQRLQALLRFKEQFISETVPAQVIGTAGTEQSRLLYIDKGSSDGIEIDMAVISPAGVVGKVVRVLPATAQVLEINDQTSGVGAILEKSRLQGILKGTPTGDAMLHYIMSDENVEIGEQVLTSGGDRIFPKGLPIGNVISVNPGKDLFLNIRVKPAARLNRVEEVLVITKVDERQPDLQAEGPQRAADILAARLPTFTVKPPEPTAGEAGNAPAQGSQNQLQTVPGGGQPKPQASPSSQAKPSGATNGGAQPVRSGVQPATNGQQPRNVSGTNGALPPQSTKPAPKPTGSTQQ